MPTWRGLELKDMKVCSDTIHYWQQGHHSKMLVQDWLWYWQTWNSNKITLVNTMYLSIVLCYIVSTKNFESFLCCTIISFCLKTSDVWSRKMTWVISCGIKTGKCFLLLPAFMIFMHTKNSPQRFRADSCSTRGPCFTQCFFCLRAGGIMQIMMCCAWALVFRVLRVFNSPKAFGEF